MIETSGFTRQLSTFKFQPSQLQALSISHSAINSLLPCLYSLIQTLKSGTKTFYLQVALRISSAYRGHVERRRFAELMKQKLIDDENSREAREAQEKEDAQTYVRQRAVLLRCYALDPKSSIA